MSAQSHFWVHPASTEVDRFLVLLNSSGIIRCSEVLSACAGFDVSRTDNMALDDLCSHLIATQVLTDWQCNKLRQGKWKGFWLHNFCLLTDLNNNDVERTYLAQEWPSGRRVRLVVTPPIIKPLVDGYPVYRVEELS